VQKYSISLWYFKKWGKFFHQLPFTNQFIILIHFQFSILTTTIQIENPAIRRWQDSLHKNLKQIYLETFLIFLDTFFERFK